jgi:hypothetical protein
MWDTGRLWTISAQQDKYILVVILELVVKLIDIAWIESLATQYILKIKFPFH